MKRLLLFIFTLMPLLAFATDEVCQPGYSPAEYVELEYIESTGTQYIDLGTLSSGCVEVRISPTRLTGGADGLGYDGILGISYNPQLGWYTTGWTTGIAGSSLPYPPVVGGIYTYKWTADDGKSYIDGFPTGLSRKGTLTLKLFYCADNPKFSKCYEYKQYDNNDVLQVNLIPVRRVSDGVIGMFDKINNKFYTNDGSGEFIAGPEVQSFIIDENNITCVLCPDNTYKPNAGNESCTKCPTGTFSPIGSTQLSDCAKILHVGEYVVYMPLGKRTEHGLCVMMDGKKYCADVYERQ